MYPYLKRKDKLPSVVAAQVLLNRKLRQGRTLSVDGIFGTKTKQAVKEFQSNNTPRFQTRGRARLKSDGIVGPNTWSALNQGEHLQIIDAVDITDISLLNLEAKDIQNQGGRPILSAAMCNGVGHVVNQILGQSNPGRVALLRFHGHGAAGGMNISAGDEDLPGEWADLDARDIRTLIRELRKLRPIFSAFGSVELHGCSTGKGPKGTALLRNLATAWGVPVSAGIFTQRGGGYNTFRFEGPVKTAIPGGGDLKSWASALPEAAGMSVHRR